MKCWIDSKTTKQKNDEQVKKKLNSIQIETNKNRI